MRVRVRALVRSRFVNHLVTAHISCIVASARCLRALPAVQRRQRVNLLQVAAVDVAAMADAIYFMCIKHAIRACVRACHVGATRRRTAAVCFVKLPFTAYVPCVHACVIMTIVWPPLPRVTASARTRNNFSGGGGGCSQLITIYTVLPVARACTTFMCT